ncbi:MAG: hypothetical protein COV30_00100 [Candidatus Yanofskybacteria bacterium CG10_big_fil_rev_8_21_14_0_10_37_15]|uniref:Fatty acid hydroxylase domain-containing protein n=1 Tax=Candidatus Yanofskybacteria bacterium CG10_big_fil_rev_8_21_14_0_10_37_15 TaxID=1975097 RepID=A0A2H0R6F5_9BACT|nr:MAG: hypothetical protein COV30_00100 [Candidatus Yanofskybacteria bacterium CG10_big_fil_rev_8_21_14_0_10_37_15]
MSIDNLELAKLFLTAVFGGSLLAEFSGYIWHRWAAHLGILRFLPNDFLRRRHFDHHESPDKYPSQENLRSSVYRDSCENTFYFLASIIVPVVGFLVLIGFMSLKYGIALILGAGIYGIVLQTTLHTLYHLEDSVLKKIRIFQTERAWKLFVWLRDCHDVHHLVRGNYFIFNPLPDIIFRTLRTKKSVSGKEEIKQDLFPNFRKELAGSCGDPVFKRKKTLAD